MSKSSYIAKGHFSAPALPLSTTAEGAGAPVAPASLAVNCLQSA